MLATDFPEATTQLLAPEGMEDEVYDLQVWKSPELDLVISKWKLTWRERFQILLTGHCWLHVVGNTHPPVSIETFFPFEV